ncbi:MAG: hypothetical protein ACM3QS_18275 [Bacteroidota bacterium]
MNQKERNTSWNTTVVVALITLCGTVASAVLASPALAVLLGGKASPTPFPPASLTGTPSANATLTPERPVPTAGFTASPTLPDLIPVAISSPVCISDHRVTSSKYVRQTVTIRNIGAGATTPFGVFSNRVVLIAGGQRYPLDQWASLYNGIIGPLELNVPGLGPNDDADLTLNIDLRGNSRYSLEVIANSGDTVIPEASTANNSLTRDFTTNCK